MEQDSVAQIMYVVHHRDNSSITGTGRFNTSMAFYTSNSFYYMVWKLFLLSTSQHMHIPAHYSSTEHTYWNFANTLTSIRWLKFHTRWHWTRTCMSKWTWGGATAPWSSTLTPVWPHHRPMISRPDPTPWSVTGRPKHSVLIFEMCVSYIFIVSVFCSHTVSVAPSDVLWTAPTRPTSLVAVPTPVSHSRPSSSCEPQSPYTSSARSWYAKLLTTIPAVAADATDERPETWGQNTTARLWSWVPSNLKVCTHLHVVLIPIED